MSIGITNLVKVSISITNLVPKRWDRLSLTDLLAKPHQRIPRYRLLIQVTAALNIMYVSMLKAEPSIEGYQIKTRQL